DRVAAQESEQQNLRLVESAIAQGKRILQEEGPRKAREFLETHSAQYSGFPQICEVYNAIATREALDSLDSKIAAEPNPAEQVQIVEQFLRFHPDNPDLQQRLADSRRLSAQISAVIDRAQGFEAAGHLSDAKREWQRLRKRYPQVPE